jgi:lipopolysaccharide transport system ATP-binding protein
MSENVIEVEHLSKQYRLGLVGSSSIQEDLTRWWASIRGKEDPFLKIGEVNKRDTKGEAQYVWSLRDINFSVKKGEVLGIIGKNGAGKSTLLKILSKVTGPTIGKIKVKGRIASLLEVGTGFHPELTGKENVYLNGAILGMRSYEIDRKFDEIVEFSGCSLYVDTPLKRYSSGMRVRLGFAVAAFLEPEILIVDEVLAVGDAEFQKKAIGKMKDVSKEGGRTVLFVSHNMASIKALCTKSMVLKDGSVDYYGSVAGGVDHYLAINSLQELTGNFHKLHVEGKDIELIEARVLSAENQEKVYFTSDEDVIVELKFLVNKKVPKAYAYIVVKNNNEDIFIESDTFDTDSATSVLEKFPLGETTCHIRIPRRILPNGRYVFYINISSSYNIGSFNIDSPKEILQFEVEDVSTRRGSKRRAFTNIIPNWEIK